MPTKEELVIEELQNKLHEMELELKALKASKAAAKEGTELSESEIQAFPAIQVESHLTLMSQVKHMAKIPIMEGDRVVNKGNPVERPAQAPLSPDFFDLTLERGYLEISRSYNQGLKHEYRHLAPMVSYFFDGLFKFKELASSHTITNPKDRQSLAVMHAYFLAIYKKLLYRMDFLKTMCGPGGRNPGLMTYIEEKVNNPLDHIPVTSDEIREAFDEYNEKRLNHLMKASSKQSAEYTMPSLYGGASGSGASSQQGGRGGRAGGRGGRDGGRGPRVDNVTQSQGPVTRSRQASASNEAGAA